MGLCLMQISHFGENRKTVGYPFFQKTPEGISIPCHYNQEHFIIDYVIRCRY